MPLPSEPPQYSYSTPVGAMDFWAPGGGRITGVSSSDLSTVGYVRPPGFDAPYGVLTISISNAPSFVTVQMLLPRPLPKGSRVIKVLRDGTFRDITGEVSISGSILSFGIYDDSEMDSDDSPGSVRDPIIILENQNPQPAGGGGCYTGSASYPFVLLYIALLALLRRSLKL
ncbi:MAG: hypothetical protein D6699_01350 [Aquificota bacterium]|nr:MAG: hypothetical protein D6699_01350 [Aquificota bacterium]